MAYVPIALNVMSLSQYHTADVLPVAWWTMRLMIRRTDERRNPAA